MRVHHRDIHRGAEIGADLEDLVDVRVDKLIEQALVHRLTSIHRGIEKSLVELMAEEKALQAADKRRDSL